jgi:riboflavin synthase alpha subunit
MKRFVIATVIICIAAAVLVTGQLARPMKARAQTAPPAEAQTVPQAASGGTAGDVAPSGAIGGEATGGSAPREMGFVRTTSGNYPRARRLAATAEAAAALPQGVDLTRYDLPVGSQGRQSSCVAWSVAYYYKTMQEAREHKWDLSRADKQFSPSFLYNQINRGADRGASFPSAFEVLKNQGETDLEECPYSQFDYLTQPNSRQSEAAKPYRIANYSYLWRGSGGNDVNEIKARLAAGDPVALGIPVYQAFYDCQGDWVDSPATNETWYGNHAVTAVGYDDTAGGGLGGIKIANSWGSWWGAGGYVVLSYRFIADYCWEAWVMNDRASDRPEVSSLSPQSGNCDTEVTISGDNFGAQRGNSAVKFAGKPATATSWSNDKIKVKVPAGAEDGEVKVFNWLGEPSNGVAFDMTLSLAGVAPGVAKPGDQTVLYGNDLGNVPGKLMMGNATLKVVSWTDNKIVFHAPSALGSGSLRAYVGDQCSNAVSFSVAASTWYLAEGCTGEGFETWVLVQNPNTSPASINVTYMTPGGAVQGPSMALAAGSRQSINVADTVPGQLQVSTRVTADKPVIAERSMYGNNRRWGSDCVGVESPTTTWYLAEGCTGEGFETWILVQNPNSTPTNIMITYMTPNGKVDGPYVSLPANSRQTFNVADTMPGQMQVSTRVDSEKPVIAERSMYWNGRTGGHDSVGVTSPATTWYLAEGCTGPGYETWILVMNPGRKDAKVTLTYMTERGEVKGPSVTLKASTRKTFCLADTVPNTTSVSTKVSADQPVIAERSVYWNNKIEGHNSAGVTDPAETWYLAEGSTGGGIETWVLIQNPNDSPAKVTLTYMTPNGTVSGPTVTLPANSRKTFSVADTVPKQWQVSTRVTADKPVIAERSMYGNGRQWGHNSAGIPK